MLIWGIWEFLVAAVISLISLMNATLACDYPALTLYESIRDEILPVIKKEDEVKYTLPPHHFARKHNKFDFPALMLL